ncbi:uncharacterized protein MAM_03998 [Metarhizium album ARSEF 1941]|uniref:BZIP transcription factor n=1 Tax=Metarhizium album (strain ARSEF 1941) TaxID=1081103 RepID=A0A0B2WXX4_METAS|nr:uncharacterized protein MAM_03998 [Metarhizium album ARSEF 1941]KHN98237.1 hypothetical protein MAM_03998 [Metarhizium album ARSEF 1941]
MASAASDLADSPDARSPSTAATAATPGAGSTGAEGAGIKRGPDGEARRDERAEAEAGADGGAGSGSGAGAKRKKKGPGSRGVANLTPEQLAKKRANDREAQRAIRERTKNQIEALERRIRELTNQKPYQDLQAVVRAKEAVEQENADIKRQLACVIGVLRPIVGSSTSGDTTHVSPTRAFSQPATAAPSPGIHQYGAATPAATASPAATLDHAQPHLQSQPPHVSPGLNDELVAASSSDAHTSPPYMTQLQSQKLQLSQGLDMGRERLGLEFLLRPGERVSRIQAGANGAQDSPRYHHVPMKHDWAASQNEQEGHHHHTWTSSDASRQEPLGSSGSSGSSAPEGHQQRAGSASGMPHQARAPPPPPQQQQQQQRRRRRSPEPSAPGSGLPFHAQQLKHSEPSCPLDSLLLNFLTERRQRIADGVPIREVIGPRYPSVSSLLNPSNSVYSHPLSRVFTDILATFPGISRLPERVASLYVMFHLMRWQISPTRENFERIPECMVPGRPQMEHAHPAWVDLLPFPAMRERLARAWDPRRYDLDNWFIPFTTSLRVSWPYEETDALLMLPDSDEVVINPVFERHIRNPDNWRLGERFARAFPELTGTYPLDPSVDC